MIINVCAKKIGPFDFNNLPLNQSFTLKVDSIKINNGGCKFQYAQVQTFKTNALPTRQIVKSLCKGDIFMVGNDMYSETKPTGTTTILAPSSLLCDSLIFC
ncbi:MAG: hypothetical protein IPO92_05885 [Saprospiraceae bacterium]|nr:hypothetical protein [Saprospiraceae bacterium]